MAYTITNYHNSVIQAFKWAIASYQSSGFPQYNSMLFFCEILLIAQL